MDDDAAQATGAVAAARSGADVTERSQQQIHDKDVSDSHNQENNQDSAMDMQHEKVKKRKAVIDDSDDD